MTISKVEITLVKLISSLGIIQGLAWAVLSFICIVMFNVSSDITFGNSYGEMLQGYFYFKYLKENPDTLISYENVVIRPSDFTVFMWIYLLSSAIWAALSIDQYVAVHSDKKRLSTVMLLWSVVVIVFSILDVILMSLLAKDYENCSKSFVIDGVDILNQYQLLCYVTTGVTMTLAARGFLLWIINVVCCISLLTIAIRIKKLAYAHKNLAIPRVKLGGDRGGDNGNNSWRNSNFPGETNSWRNPKPPTPEGNNGGWRSPGGGNFGEPQYLRENKRFA